MMTYLYFLPPSLRVLVGLNKSMCNSFNGLEVETSLSDLKKDLLCFPSLHAS
ncbi:hypothetical protein Fmac_008720 [Flemingia macrophylla]|uniref:Uncharacterized protein n=1 Tax=Flemingia macrophylla TaxID=520843 RepID=A0ABD1MY78_9FABA